MPPPANDPSSEGRRIVICDYNALLLSVTGLLRMSGYRVFQAYDGLAARELCHALPNIDLVILNSIGPGTDTRSLVRLIRREHADLAILHIGASQLAGMPSDVPTLAESFTADELLSAVESLMPEAEPRARTGIVPDGPGAHEAGQANRPEDDAFSMEYRTPMPRRALK